VSFKLFVNQAYCLDTNVFVLIWKK